MRNLIDEILDETFNFSGYETENFELDLSNSTTYLPFMQNLVKIAKQELARWKNGSKKETDPSMTSVLKEYYKTGVNDTVSDADLRSGSWQSGHPWSAVFISWVLRTAGAGTYFKYARGHWVYVADAKKKRQNRDIYSIYWAYRINERKPQLGDLLCTSRAGSGLTYDTVEKGGSSHCDIVTEVHPNRVVVVGGNVNNSVDSKTLRLDSSGFLDAKKHPNHFAILSIY